MGVLVGRFVGEGGVSQVSVYERSHKDGVT